MSRRDTISYWTLGVILTVFAFLGGLLLIAAILAILDGISR